MERLGVKEIPIEVIVTFFRQISLSRLTARSSTLASMNEVLAQTGRIRAIVRMAKMGYHLVEPEQPSGEFNGTVDFVFEDAARHKTKVKAKSSKSLRPWDIVQCILYGEPGDKIAISSVDEFLEPEDWLVGMVNSAVRDFADFYEEFPDVAAGTHMPYRSLCERCTNSECGYRKHN